MKTEVQLRFDYGALDTDSRRFVQERAERIHNLARMTAAGIVQIGQYLTEVKERVGHGKFLGWIEMEFEWNRMSAERFMRVHDEFKMHNLCNMKIDVSALYLIAAPKTPEPVRVEAARLAVSGERVTHGTVKAVIAEYNKTGDANVAVGQLFRAVAESRRETVAILPSPAEARRTAIATGAHTLDRNGTYQPPISVQGQEDYRRDMLATDPVFQLCRWVANKVPDVRPLAPEEAARIVIERHWQDYYLNLDRAIAWMTAFREQLCAK